MGLHFDLTVPFARYVLENAGKLDFPFRRYQIQKAWRGERPQEGRYREFTQADIDVVMRDELPFHFDVEVARVMAEALAALPLPPMRLRVNNRKLIEGFYRGIGAPDPAAVITAIDKLDKLPRDAGRCACSARPDSTTSRSQCLPGASRRSSRRTPRSRSRCEPSASSTSCWTRGSTSSPRSSTGCSAVTSDRFRVVASLSLARGLDYYTGTVFEIYMDGFESLKSVGGGGRYDALASDGKHDLPGRRHLLRHLPDPAAADEPRAAVRRPLGAVGRPRGAGRRGVTARTATASRSGSGPAASRPRWPPSPQRFGKQIRYAERRGIPFVWFPGADGEGDQVKDIRSGDQVDADADGWRPPDEDLRPRVVVSGTTPDRATRSRTSDPHARRRQPPGRAVGRDRHARRLGGPPPRPRRRRLHRPA